MSKARLDRLLVKRGLAPDRDEARALIEDKRVLVNGLLNQNLSSQVDTGADLKLTDTDQAYVSRGAHKLVKGLDSFAIDPAGLVCMDVGASTGGFTDVLLRRDAKRVFAIDVGYGQLAWSLRQDARVTVLERQNIRTMDPAKIDETPDLCVIDVSFISLTLILGPIATIMGPGKRIVALIKPQFEARKEQVGEGGVVRDPVVHQECIEAVRLWAGQRDFEVGEVVESPIRGPAGNIEFLILLTTPP